jgi:HEAT repeat protein
MADYVPANDVEEIPFQRVLDALLDAGESFDPRYLYRLSDLEQTDLAEFQSNWPHVPVQRRLAVLQDIEKFTESNYLLSFKAVCKCALGDVDARVRQVAIRSLWEYEDGSLIPLFLNLLESDKDPDVRAVSATALGKYIYLGEIDEIPVQSLDEIVDRLLAILDGSNATLVKRRALESLGYSGRPEVPPHIERAYHSNNDDWLASSLSAMGRSANSDWSGHVLEQLTHDSSEVRLEAARAVGELETRAAIGELLNLLDDDDDRVRMAAVWSLSQLGGEGIADVLVELLALTEDEEQVEFIEQALDNLAFTDDMAQFSFFELEDEFDGGDNGINLYQDDDVDEAA